MKQQISLVIMPNGNVTLTPISDAVIIENGWYTDTLHSGEDGLLLAHGGSWRRDWSEAEPWWQMSADGGVTWQPYVQIDNRDHTRIRPNLCRRLDDSVIGWAGAWDLKAAYQGRPGQPILQTVVRAASCEALVMGQGTTIETTVSLPYMVPLTGDDISQPPAYTPAIWGKLVEADHGYLIQAAYPRLAYDNAPRLWAEQKEPAYKYRTCVIYSQDDGASWRYLSTVASPEQYPLPALSEGYCEPDLLYFGDGSLLCVMRTGGNIGTLMDRCTALVASQSADGGLTWSTPEPISAYGVAPMLLQMQSGLVVCLSGRPGFFLLFSADEGKTWSPPHWLCESPGPWHQSASGYGQLIELEPGVLGVAYDDYVGEGDAAHMVTMFRRFRVEMKTEGV